MPQTFIIFSFSIGRYHFVKKWVDKFREEGQKDPKRKTKKKCP